MSKLRDLTGQQFGRLHVLRVDPVPHVLPCGAKRIYWICRCDCGKEVSVSSSSLIAKKNPARSCGCLRKEKSRAVAKDIRGMRFGYWTVIDRVEIDKHYTNGHACGWLCRCDCGTERVLETATLTKGKSTNCGCDKGKKSSRRIKEDNVFCRYDGTHVTAIRPGLKLLSNNKSGVRGVYFENDSQKWVAMIGLKGKTIKLGRFKDKEDAIKARKEGEEKYFAPIIKAFEAEKKDDLT